ncbi:MAG: hypothetical protein HY300_05955 [Verrucomicrobia bacterium]|nr:hypothetical protein [Verrucomicrobiota bacterium]
MNSPMLRHLLPIFSVIAAALPLFAADAPRVFRAGAAASVITPKLGTSINGNMQDGTARHIHDELHARCLALDDGTNKLVLVVNDACMIPREVFDEAKRLVTTETGLPPECMVMSATHTHSAGTSASVFQSEADMEYRAFLAGRIADGVRRALNNLAPARIGWAVGREPTQVFNRRWFMKPGTKLPNPFGGEDKVKMNPGVANPSLLEPAGPTDPEVSILSVVSTNGRPIAVFANYSLHYVGGTAGGAISADYYGMFCERMAELLGAEKQDPPFVALMSNGTSGNINNINWPGPVAERKAPYEQMKFVANTVAAEAYKAWLTIKHADWVPLKSVQKELTLGVRKPAQEELVRAKEIMSRAKTIPRMATLDEIYARETVQMDAYPPEVKCILQAHRIGDVGVFTIPCEVFVEIGLELKQRSALKPAFTISLANGYNGYLPTPEHHALGGYETWRAKSSYVEVEASKKITATLLELQQQLGR